MTDKTLFGDDAFDVSDLDLDRNPAGPRSHSIRTKPTGVRRLNQNGIIIAAVLLFVALIVATMTFSGSGSQDNSKKTPDANVVNPKGQWYVDIPESQPIPDLSAASAPTVTAATAPKEVTPELPKIQPQPQQNVQAPPPPPDPLVEMRKQHHMQALAAGLSAQGFQSTALPTGNNGFGDMGQNKLRNSSEDRIADRLAALSQSRDGEGDDQNKQAQKEKFLKDIQQLGDSDYHKEGRKKPISPYEVKAGTIIPSVMIGGINSDLPGQILAQVRENVYDTRSGQHVLIPQGSRLVGAYDSHVAYGQERVLIAWSRIIYPDGSSLNLKGMPGADAAGYSGLSDEVDNHYFRIFGSSILMSAISAGVQMSQGGSVPGAFQQQSTAQLATSAMGQQLGQTGSHLIQKNINIQPTLTIRNGEPFNVIVTADLVLPVPEQE